MDRSFWLEKYRYCLHNGYSCISASRWNWDVDKGIKTAHLKWTTEVIEDQERMYPRARRYRSGDKNVFGKLYAIVYRIEAPSNYVIPLSMNARDSFGKKKFTRGMLLQNCKENNLVGIDEKGFSRKTLISKLMSI